MTHEEMSGRELLDEFQKAIENLPGSGAAGRQWVADVQAELLERLEPEKFELEQLEGDALLKGIEEVEKYHENREGKPPRNIVASMQYAIHMGIQFDAAGKIREVEG